MTKICGECVFFIGCSRYVALPWSSRQAETCRTYLTNGEESTMGFRGASTGWRLNRHAEWVKRNIENGREAETLHAVAPDERADDWVYCSACREMALKDLSCDIVLSRYCPHCGAEMTNYQTEEQRTANWQRYVANRVPATVLFEDPNDEPEGVTPDIVITEIFGG